MKCRVDVLTVPIWCDTAMRKIQVTDPAASYSFRKRNTEMNITETNIHEMLARSELLDVSSCVNSRL